MRIIALAAVVLALGCGVKAPPRPPVPDEQRQTSVRFAPLYARAERAPASAVQR